MEKTLFKIKKGKENFEKLFSDVSATISNVLNTLKSEGVEISDFMQLEIYASEHAGDPHKEDKTIIENACWQYQGLTGWKLKCIPIELFEISNGELIIDKAGYEKYLQDEFYIYEDSEQYTDKKLAALKLIEALNEGVKHWPHHLSFLDLPLMFSFDGKKYKIRKEHLTI